MLTRLQRDVRLRPFVWMVPADLTVGCTSGFGRHLRIWKLAGRAVLEVNDCCFSDVLGHRRQTSGHVARSPGVA